MKSSILSLFALLLGVTVFASEDAGEKDFRDRQSMRWMATRVTRLYKFEVVPVLDSLRGGESGNLSVNQIINSRFAGTESSELFDQAKGRISWKPVIVRMTGKRFPGKPSNRVFGFSGSIRELVNKPEGHKEWKDTQVPNVYFLRTLRIMPITLGDSVVLPYSKPRWVDNRHIEFTAYKLSFTKSFTDSVAAHQIDQTLEHAKGLIKACTDGPGGLKKMFDVDGPLEFDGFAVSPNIYRDVDSQYGFEVSIEESYQLGNAKKTEEACVIANYEVQAMFFSMAYFAGYRFDDVLRFIEK